MREVYKTIDELYAAGLVNNASRRNKNRRLLDGWVGKKVRLSIGFGMRDVVDGEIKKGRYGWREGYFFVADDNVYQIPLKSVKSIDKGLMMTRLIPPGVKYWSPKTDFAFGSVKREVNEDD